MDRRDLDFELPDDLIAQHPVEPRDAARMLVLDRAAGTIDHRLVRDLPEYLHAGDLVVVNDTRVLPARFFARRPTGARIEGLFLAAEHNQWHVLLKPSARLRPAERLRLTMNNEPIDHVLVLLERRERGEWLVTPEPTASAEALLNQIGITPLPPYIHRDAVGNPTDAQHYQTVYASQPGAVAAPTAGLHFTPELINAIRARQVEWTTVTLHVGLGTFAPIAADALDEHEMHSEWYCCPRETLNMLESTRAAGRSVTAIGTTAVRALESAATRINEGWTDIFIRPGYAFRNVDHLLTNFHLPGSTLIALVMAFAGVELTRRAYNSAIRARYRFYSYGDAMLIL